MAEVPGIPGHRSILTVTEYLRVKLESLTETTNFALGQEVIDKYRRYLLRIGKHVEFIAACDNSLNDELIEILTRQIDSLRRGLEKVKAVVDSIKPSDSSPLNCVKSIGKWSRLDKVFGDLDLIEGSILVTLNTLMRQGYLVKPDNATLSTNEALDKVDEVAGSMGKEIVEFEHAWPPVTNYPTITLN